MLTEAELNIALQNLCHQRVSLKRSSSPGVSGISNVMVSCFSFSKDHTKLLSTLNQFVDLILDDCEIFFNMNQTQVQDARQELSNLATIYAPLENHHYIRCCEILKSYSRSYN